MLSDLKYVTPNRSFLRGEYHQLIDRASHSYGRSRVPYSHERVRDHREGMKQLGAAVARSGAIRRGAVDWDKLLLVIGQELYSPDQPLDLDLEQIVCRVFAGDDVYHPVVAMLRRDKGRFTTQYWSDLPWASQEWFAQSGLPASQAPHVATGLKNQGMVAFAESVDKRITDRFTIMKPGRYLQRYFGDVLDTKEIKRWADEMARQVIRAEVKFAEDERTMIRVVNLGPSESCMSAAHHGRERWYDGHIHPAAIYDTPDIHIAYLENRDGDVVARAVCNKKDKLVARVYGDARLLLPALETLGYKHEREALNGCRIRKIESARGEGYIMAYVDAGIGSGQGHLYFRDYDTQYWKLTDDPSGYSTYEGYENNGVARLEPRVCCDHCEEQVDEDDTRYVDWTGTTVCNCCLDNNFIYAYTRWRIREFVPNDDVIYCETDGEYYAERHAFEYSIFLCDETNRWYHIDEMVSVVGGMVHMDRAVALDVPDCDGNEYAVTRHTTRTHDGRTIMEEDAVTHDDKVYHKDDDYDTEAEAEAGE